MSSAESADDSLPDLDDERDERDERDEFDERESCFFLSPARFFFGMLGLGRNALKGEYDLEHNDADERHGRDSKCGRGERRGPHRLLVDRRMRW